jgi:hypothetical protein
MPKLSFFFSNFKDTFDLCLSILIFLNFSILLFFHINFPLTSNSTYSIFNFSISSFTFFLLFSFAFFSPRETTSSPTLLIFLSSWALSLTNSFYYNLGAIFFIPLFINYFFLFYENLLLFFNCFPRERLILYFSSSSLSSFLSSILIFYHLWKKQFQIMKFENLFSNSFIFPSDLKKIINSFFTH